MAYTIGTITARASSSGNPITTSVQILPGETLLVVMLVGTGATNRAGGSLTYDDKPLTQANTTQKAAASPEASAELWYLVNPPVGTRTLTIPNTGAIAIRYVVARAKAPAGAKSMFDSANGANNTSTNPTVTVTTFNPNLIVFAVVANGAQSWGPSGRTGTQISDTDDGATGDGFQYLITATPSAQAMAWTFGTSEDWGVVAAAFAEVAPPNLQNYFGIRVGDGMGTNERIR